MEKTQMIDKIAEETNVAKKDIQKVVDRGIEIMKNELSEGGSIHLKTFGTFETKTIKSRKGHDFKTSGVVDIPERKEVRFRPSKNIIIK